MMKKDRLESIDFLRGIAILMIIIVHSPQKLAGINEIVKQGTKIFETGCQLFFVLSGFCLAMSWYSGDKNIKKFYHKRFFSIAPLYYFMIPFYFVLNGVLSHYNLYIGFSQNASWRPILNNVFFIHGFLYEGHNNVVPGGWYIGVSMFFYAVFPAIITTLKYIAKRAYKVVLFIPFLVFFINEFFAFNLLDKILLNLHADEIINYRDILLNLPCFLMGIILYFVYSEGRMKMLITGRQIVVSAMILCMITGIVINNYYFFTTVSREFIDGTLFAMLFIFVISIEEKIKNSEVFKAISNFGAKSYYIYFVHFLYMWYVMPMIFQYIDVLNGHKTIKYLCILLLLLPMIYVTSIGISIVDRKFTILNSQIMHVIMGMQDSYNRKPRKHR